MGSSDVIDIDAIQRPISAENPAGKNLRADASPTSTYYRLKEARSVARLAERKAETGEQISPDWRTILEQASKILVEESKDLEVAAWLTEALCRLHGFAGLAQGFRATRILVDGFWDGLWPRPDEEGLITRLAPLTGLNGEDTAGTLIAPITSIPISMGRDGEALATWQYQKALEISRITDPERKERAGGTAGITLAAFQQSVAETPAGFFKELVESLQASIDEYEQLGAALDRVCAADAPPSSNIRNALQEVLGIVQALAKDKLASSNGEDARDPAGSGGPATSATASLGGAVQSREAAFQSLVRVADYFRQAEPHSPLSYMLEQAVRWGRLPLPELLDELIPDESARTQFMKLAGIRAAKKE